MRAWILVVAVLMVIQLFSAIIAAVIAPGLPERLGYAMRAAVLSGLLIWLATVCR